MRVFVTGASGHIGSAVIPELLGSGHEVVGLARSDASALMLQALGAEVRRGDLDDLDGLREAVVATDAVIHLAFKHEAMQVGDYAGAIAADLRAIEAMGEALEGSGKPFVGTGGTLMLALAGITERPGTERDVVDGGMRVDAENTVVALSQRGVRSSQVRLPPLVHSPLDHHGFGPTLIGIARATGVAGYAGDGSNRWPAVDTRDAAHLYRLALEAAPAGARLHAVGDRGVPFRDIAGAIGRHLGVPVEPIAADDVSAHFGYLAPLVGLDNPVTSELTTELLGWVPTRPGLIADLDEGHYFADPAAA